MKHFKVVCAKSIYGPRDVEWHKGDIFSSYSSKIEAEKQAKNLNEDSWCRNSWVVKCDF